MKCSFFFSNKTKIQAITYITKGFIYQNICNSAAFNRDVFIQNKNFIWGDCFRCLSVQYVKNRVPCFQSYKLYQPLHAVWSHRLFYFVASFPACLLGTKRCMGGCNDEQLSLHSLCDATDHWCGWGLFHEKQRNAVLEERTWCADQSGRRSDSLVRITRVFWNLKWGV